MNITIKDDRVINSGFIGAGYHASFPVHHRQTTRRIEKILHGRWQECRPAFARVTHQWKGSLPHLARQIAMMRECGTQVYLTTWDPECVREPAALRQYAGRVAAMLKELVVRRGLNNIRWYCMANELSLYPKSGWGGMYSDLPRFAAYHKALYDAFKKEKLPVGLLATDASPIERWDSINWAAKNMKDISAAYGGHHYINMYPPGDLDFYSWFYGNVRKKASLAHGQKKPFLMGEFGPRQHFGPRYGIDNWDGCAYFNSAAEPYAALQTAEAVMAAVNAGADAVGYWTFTDYPDDYSRNRSYVNKWGTFIWDGKKFKRRYVYYPMGLLARFFRGPAKVYKLNVRKPGLRAMALRNTEYGTLNIAVLNWNTDAVKLKLAVPRGMRGSIYTYEAGNPGRYDGSGGLLETTFVSEAAGAPGLVIPAQSFTVYSGERVNTD